MRTKAKRGKARCIWMNGKLIPWENATIHILTHALHYGTAVFEGIRCYKTKKGPAVFRLRDHLLRLKRSAKAYRMRVPYSAQQLRKAIKALIVKNALSDCYIRPIVYYGMGNVHVYPGGAEVNVAIAAWPCAPYLGKKELKEGIRCTVSSWRKVDQRTLPVIAKASGNYSNSALAIMEAKERGYDEAILLNLDGMVAEGSAENIFIVKNGMLITPPTSAGILSGFIRDSVMRIAKDKGIPAKERNFTKYELFSSDEAFLTGTAAGICPIREVDGIEIGNERRGPITRLLQSKFSDATRGRDRRYAKWLDFVR